MRVVVFGATGNVGSTLVRALAAEPEVDEVLGVARRRPALELPKTTWAEADVASDELLPLVRGADTVVHLAWAIQPSRELAELERINVEGSARVFAATAAANVPALVYASSVGAYSAGPKDRLVDESWPTRGIASSFYSRHKAKVESALDVFERDHPEIRVVRLRPGLIFKRSAATGIRRLFVGPFLPSPLLRRQLVPVFPDVTGLRFQAVHTDDVAAAYVRSVVGEARGPFNLAAEPVLDPQLLADLLGARLVRVSPAVARLALTALWHLHLEPSPPGWLDLGLGVPLLDTTRARNELGWAPEKTSVDAVRELLEGMRAGADERTPPLSSRTSGPLRIRELATRVGRRSG
jgi:UDP-glucose 4-epimerase